MNSQAANELSQVIMFWGWVMNIGAIAVLISSICSVVMMWEIMKNGRGANRVAWVFAVWLPIFGPLMFLFLWQKELESVWMEQHSQKR